MAATWRLFRTASSRVRRVVTIFVTAGDKMVTVNIHRAEYPVDIFLGSQVFHGGKGMRTVE